jgi:hypothetical protein
VFIGRDLANMGNVAAQSLELVDSETRRIVHEAEETARQVLAINVSVLEDLANSLLRAETLSGPSLDVYMEAVKMWPESLIKDGNGHSSRRHRSPIQLRQDSSTDYLDEGDTELLDEEPER